MKTLSVLFTLMILSFWGYTQEIEEKNDTIKIKIGNKKVLIIEDKSVVIEEGDSTVTVYSDSLDNDTCDGKPHFEGHWAGVELGLNSYLSAANSFSMGPSTSFMELDYPKSVNVNINFMEFNVGLFKDKIGLTTGMGLEMNNYRFKNRNVLLNDQSSELTYTVDNTINYKKNKLFASYLTVPLLLEFQLPVNKDDDRIFFSVGAFGGLRVMSHTKLTYELNGTDYKNKNRDDYFLSPFKYGVTARIGYKGVCLFANYTLSTMFEANKGPELYPFSAGIVLLSL